MQSRNKSSAMERGVCVGVKEEDAEEEEGSDRK